MLIVGNFKEQDALTLSLDISSILGLTSNTLPEICSKVARIEPGQVIEWNSKHITSNQPDSENEDMSAGEEGGEDEISEIDESDEEKGNGENNSVIQVYY